MSTSAHARRKLIPRSRAKRACFMRASALTIFLRQSLSLFRFQDRAQPKAFSVDNSQSQDHANALLHRYPFQGIASAMRKLMLRTLRVFWQPHLLGFVCFA